MDPRDATADNNRENDTGFSLLEVIIAISLLTVGLLAVASMQVSAIRSNATAHAVAEASTWATDMMEKLIELPYNHVYLQDTDGDGTDQDLDADGVDDDGGNFGLEDNTPATADYHVTRVRYTLYWNVAADAIIKDTKTINVIATWTDHGSQKSVSIRNILPRI